MKSLQGFKHFVIAVNDILGILLFCSLVLLSTMVIPFIGTLGAGVAVCVVTGFWYVLSGIYTNGTVLIEEQQTTNQLLAGLIKTTKDNAPVDWDFDK